MSELRAAAETAVQECLELASEVLRRRDRRRARAHRRGTVRGRTRDHRRRHRRPVPAGRATRCRTARTRGRRPRRCRRLPRADDQEFESHPRTFRRDRRRARGATLPELPRRCSSPVSMPITTESTRCERTLERVSGADEIRVTTDRGTDITFELGDREWFDDTGDVSQPGSFSNLLPARCSSAPNRPTAPTSSTARCAHGLLEAGQELEFVVEDGFVTEISDDEIRQQVEEAAEDAGDVAYNLAELGIGTNVGVTELVGSVLLDEKAAGTVHIAIGDNAGIGGETDAPSISTESSASRRCSSTARNSRCRQRRIERRSGLEAIFLFSLVLATVQYRGRGWGYWWSVSAPHRPRRRTIPSVRPLRRRRDTSPTHPRAPGSVRPAPLAR